MKTTPRKNTNTYTVHAPTNAGAYHQRFSWLVKTPDDWTAYSGDEKGARGYARAMNKRLAREHR